MTRNSTFVTTETPSRIASAAITVERALTSDPPYGARVTYTGESAPGWNAPSFDPWLSDASRV